MITFNFLTTISNSLSDHPRQPEQIEYFKYTLQNLINPYQQFV